MVIDALLHELPDSIRYNNKTYYLSFYRADDNPSKKKPSVSKEGEP
jgi:hypothetical protein